MELFQDPSGIEELRRRRKRIRRRRKIKWLCLYFLLPLLMIAIFLFSPVGPLRGVFFSSSERSEGYSSENECCEDSGPHTSNGEEEGSSSNDEKSFPKEKLSVTTPPTLLSWWMTWEARRTTSHNG